MASAGMFEIAPGLTVIGRARGGQAPAAAGGLRYRDLLLCTAASEAQALLSFDAERGELRIKDHPARVNGSFHQPTSARTARRLPVHSFVPLGDGDSVGLPLEWFLVRIANRRPGFRAFLVRDTTRETLRIRLCPAAYAHDRLRVDLDSGHAAVGGVPLPLHPQARLILRELCRRQGDAITRLDPDVEIALGLRLSPGGFCRRISEIRTALRAAGSAYARLIETLPGRPASGVETGYLMRPSENPPNSRSGRSARPGSGRM